MKNLLDRDLELLHQEIMQMGALCEQAISSAVEALEKNNTELAKKVLEIESETNIKERSIEDICLKSLLRQQPVAKDLRKISAALKMITDMERIADQARDIAEIALTLDLSNKIKKLPEIANATIKMVSDSIDSYVTSDLEACKKVIEYDNIVDDLYNEIHDDIVAFVTADVSKVQEGMYALMVAKYFERIADHATNIAEWVEFSITAKHKGEQLF